MNSSPSPATAFRWRRSRGSRMAVPRRAGAIPGRALYVMASLLQCPVYLLFSLRRGRGSEIHFELFRESIQLAAQDRARRACRCLAAAYAARLEYYCRRAPLQWFNFYDFWQLGRRWTTMMQPAERINSSPARCRFDAGSA